MHHIAAVSSLKSTVEAVVSSTVYPVCTSTETSTLTTLQTSITVNLHFFGLLSCILFQFSVTCGYNQYYTDLFIKVSCMIVFSL